MSEAEQRTYQDTGLKEENRRPPWWLVIVWAAIIGWGAYYIYTNLAP